MRISSLDMQRSGINSIFNAQAKVLRTNLQLSSQKKYLNPADDPLASGKIRAIQSNVEVLKNYQTNNLAATTQLSQAEDTLTNFITSVLKVDEIQKQGANGTLNNSDKQVLVKELEQVFDELVGLANTKDAEGYYIFSGYKNSTPPYSNQGGTYVYQGDSGRRMIKIGTSLQVATSFSGYDIFENVLNGNGTFNTTNGSGTNSGSGVIATGRLVDESAYVADDYTLSFVTNSSGNLAYQIVGATQGQVVPSLPAILPDDAPDFVANQNITFNGIEFSIEGTPAMGDDFGIEPSRRQNIFSTVNDLIATLKMPTDDTASQAQFLNEMSRISVNLENGLNSALGTLTQVGANMNILENAKTVNDDLIIHNEGALSQLQDLDPIEAISRLVNEMTALEAAQASFSKIQQLSLFNYI